RARVVPRYRPRPRPDQFRRNGRLRPLPGKKGPELMDILAAFLLVLGALLMLIAAIGIIRLRDPLQRMHSPTKAGTLGTILLVAGVLVGADAAPISTGLLAILFLMFTLPLAAQLLGRAAYLSGTPLVGIEKTAIPGLEVCGRDASPPEEDAPR